MEAPERLYLRKRNKLPLEVVRDEWYETDPQSPFGSVGYTRTDAFIEKAAKYLEEHLFDYWSQCVTDESKFVEDFRKYMEE